MSKIKPAIQKQINQVKFWLSEGLTTQQIEEKFTQSSTNLHYSKKTIATRIKEAKLQLQPVLEESFKELDSRILEREKNAQKRIKNAYIGMIEFQAGLVEDILKTVNQQLKSKNNLAYLDAFKTAQKAGLQIKDLIPSLRLENGLPNVISKNENQNLEITPKHIIAELQNLEKINLDENE